MYKVGWFWLFTNFSEIKSPRRNLPAKRSCSDPEVRGGLVHGLPLVQVLMPPCQKMLKLPEIQYAAAQIFSWDGWLPVNVKEYLSPFRDHLVANLCLRTNGKFLAVIMLYWKLSESRLTFVESSPKALQMLSESRLTFVETPSKADWLSECSPKAGALKALQKLSESRLTFVESPLWNKLTFVESPQKPLKARKSRHLFKVLRQSCPTSATLGEDWRPAILKTGLEGP